MARNDFSNAEANDLESGLRFAILSFRLLATTLLMKESQNRRPDPGLPVWGHFEFHGASGPFIGGKGKMLLRDYVPTHCGTGPIAGLTKQVIDMLMSELPPGTLVDISAHVNAVGATTLPFVQSAGAAALIAAIQEKGQKLPLVHALRVLPQQFALRFWAQHGRCGIPAAAPPSKSNHEGANAIDVAGDFSVWKSVLNHHDWKQTVLPNDPAHFEFTGAHDPDFVVKAVSAFQKLWNLHNPGDLISTEGTFGKETKKRLEASPIAGF